MHANHSYLPPCLLPGGDSVSTEQTGNATQGLPSALPVSPGVAFLTQATSSHGGGTTHRISHKAKTPAQQLGRKDQTQYSFCMQQVPTHWTCCTWESFSTLRERVATSLGAVGRGWCCLAQKQGSIPRSPTPLALTPPPGLPNTKIDSFFIIYLH